MNTYKAVLAHAIVLLALLELGYGSFHMNIYVDISMAKVKWIFIFHFHYHWHRTMTSYILICLSGRFKQKLRLLTFWLLFLSVFRLIALLHLYLPVRIQLRLVHYCGCWTRNIYDTWDMQNKNCFHYKPNELGGIFSLPSRHTCCSLFFLSLSLSLCAVFPLVLQIT